MSKRDLVGFGAAAVCAVALGACGEGGGSGAPGGGTLAPAPNQPAPAQIGTSMVMSPVSTPVASAGTGSMAPVTPPQSSFGSGEPADPPEPVEPATPMAGMMPPTLPPLTPTDSEPTDSEPADSEPTDPEPTEGPSMGSGMCCDDGDCLCHGDAPSGLTSRNGPYDTDNYTVSAGCIYYPTDADPPFAAVAVSDGFLGSGGCGSFQTGRWGTLYASHGIVAMIIRTGSADQPATRGRKLGMGIAAFKSENEKSGGELYQKLAGRYGTSGFSMGGGGTTYAARDDDSLLTNVAIMPWGPVNRGVDVPSLVICGASDGTASCRSHGTPAYNGIASSVPKMKVTVSGGHNGQPTAGGGDSGEAGLAFQKVFLEGDERWRSLLMTVDADDTNIR